jgi:hypothetical protein
MSDSKRSITQVLAAKEIYDSAHLKNLWMNSGDPGISLMPGQVIETDGPGAGRSDDEGREPFVEVSGDRVLRKVLFLDRAPETSARIAFIGMERKGHPATLRLSVNGHEILREPSQIATPQAKQYWELAPDEGAWSWSRWYYVDLPADCLKAGENEILINSADGNIGWSLMVADYRDFEKGAGPGVELPAASQVSSGDDWKPERGEYVVRLSLDDYRRQGSLTSVVLDASGDVSPVKRAAQVSSVKVDWDAEVPDETGIEFAYRTGKTPVFDDAHWGEWHACDKGEQVSEIQGRYFQFSAKFETRVGARSPVLTSVSIDSEVQDSAPLPYRVVGCRNEEILRTSVAFEHEDYKCEMLQELRRRFELDAVVAGAQTEFERIERLMEWAYFVPLGNCRHYPWDILDWLILDRDDSGQIKMNTYEQRRRDNMCLYPNVALVAALLSFGIPARHLNFHSEGMTGHEIAEVWSNDYRKWIHLDATRDFYYFDPANCIPMDTLEIHDVLMQRVEGIERWDRPYLFRQDIEEVTKDLPIGFREGNHKMSVVEGGLFLFRSFSHFRIIPRNNTFSEPGPLPVSQGTEVWAWDGYLNWADEKTPRLLHFNGHSNRRADMYPTLNQTRFHLEQGTEEGQVTVTLETETPCFTGFQIRFDLAEWVPSDDTFSWALTEGLNTLEVRSVNSTGATGIISSITLSV